MIKMVPFSKVPVGEFCILRAWGEVLPLQKKRRKRGYHLEGNAVITLGKYRGGEMHVNPKTMVEFR